MPVYTYTTLDDPSGVMGTTTATGINNAGQIVGTYQTVTSGHQIHGFLYSGGTYTTIDDPLATGKSSATGINDAGQVVGFYLGNDGHFHGFLYSGGAYTALRSSGRRHR